MLRPIVFILCSLFVFNYSFASSSEPPKDGEKKTQESESDISLGKDREYLDQLRKDTPEDVKSKNDDLAFVLKLFEDKKRKPSKIRRQFDHTIRRMRKKKQKEFKKRRKEFTKIEKSQRKAFLKEAKKKRKEFLSEKKDKDDKKEFFDTERSRRKEYFSEEREKRKDFESEMRSQKKEFDSFVREKRKEFDDLFREFKREQKEIKKAEKEAKKAAKKRRSHRPQKAAVSEENQKYLNDFDKIPKRGGSPLQPKEE